MCAGLWFFHGQRAHALSEPVVVEIDDGAEALLDARAARRLLALELSDIAVPASGPGKHQRSTLFFRIVQNGENLRVELWERGELHGARVVSGSRVAGQLGARRVALAAAELARRLQKKRQIQADRELHEARSRALAAEREARLTVDGPLALRPSFEGASLGRFSSLLFGPRLVGQWSFARRARLDGGAAWLSGMAPNEAKLEWFELSVAPMVRIPLSEAWDFDAGAEAAAAVARFASVRGVDSIVGQTETWSARAALVLQLEPRLSRRVRLSLGATGGLLLREMPFEPATGGRSRERGAWLALDLGLVFTPP